MFAIAIRYLNGWAMATDPSDRTRPEWPPHPDRVFMALSAAHFETGADIRERAALEWLEQQDPPEIAASECEERQAVTSYVPVNDVEISRKGPITGRLKRIEEIEDLKKAKDKGLSLLPEHRLRNARNFPVALPANPTVHFIWPAVAPPEEIVAAMNDLCRKVTCVGHSASLVQAWVDEHPPEASLEPGMGHARHRLRMFGPGRLRELERLYGSERIEAHRNLAERIEQATGKLKRQLKADMESTFGDRQPTPQRPRPALWQGFDRRTRTPTSAASVKTVFGDSFLILRCRAGTPIPLESTLQLSKAVRDTFLKLCPVQPPPEWYSGHAPEGQPSQSTHAAFFPLPDVGHDHADGHIMGVGIALPRTINAEERNRCFRDVLFDRLGRAQPVKVVMGRLGVWELILEEGEGRPLALLEETWTAADGNLGARRWTTVTPIVFDRHPNLTGADQSKLAALGAEERNARRTTLLVEQTEAMVKEACRRIGLPAPLDVVLSPVSCHAGVPPARSFPCIRRKTGGNLHHTHAVLIFPEAVAGPIALGAGRYRGYGLCRPLRDGGGA